ncbi:MAG: hypothetical protein ACJ71T_10765 [Actinomycetales bacterium]
MIEADLPLVFTREHAVRAGYTDKAVDWRLSSGAWRTLRRAVFCPASAYETASPEQRHVLAGCGVLLAMDADEVISHLTAALAYGWPAPLDVDAVPWTTLAAQTRGVTRRRNERIRQVAPLPDHHVNTRLGVPLTSPPRTVADCLRHLPAEASVPIADYAVGHGVDLEAVARILRWQESWPYAARGRASIELVDPRRESWLESRSAVAWQRLGVPAPTSQVDLFDERGRHVARVDFLWADLGVVGEADGWAKYPLAAEPSGQWDALRAEKVREDRLRDLGYEVVRWTTADVMRPDALLGPRLARTLARARPHLVRGTRRTSPVPEPHVVPAAGLSALARLSPTGQVLARTRSYSLEPGDLAS